MGEMPDEEWIETIADGRRVKFTSRELPGDRAFITAQIETNKVVYSILLAKQRIRLAARGASSDS